jgi:hypothetical protein
MGEAVFYHLPSVLWKDEDLGEGEKWIFLKD